MIFITHILAKKYLSVLQKKYFYVLRGQRELFMEKVPQNQPHAPFPNNL